MTRGKRPLFSWREGILESGLPPTTRHVLLTLSCHMNDLGESCFPSTRLLSHETGLSERAVVNHLRKAKEAGWLKVDLHGFGGQRWRKHQYTVAIPEGTERRTSHSVTEEGGDPEKGDERGAPPSPESPVDNSVDNPVDNSDPAAEPRAEGADPDDQKALNDVQCNSSVNSPENSPIAVPAQAAQSGQPGQMEIHEQDPAGPSEFFELGKQLFGSGGGR